MTISDRKRNGKFYTPDDVARILVEWATRGRVGTVLDPSFGGCAFLNSALDVLAERRAREPWALIYGVDSDADARGHLHRLLKAGARPAQFLTADFLGLSPSDMASTSFDAVVGNPPYVRHHLLSHSAISRARRAMQRSGVSVSGRSSYWVYFLVHALQFLKPGGRLAFVLPGAFLHADYAREIREVISRAFDRTTWIVLGERLFEHAEETTVVLLASGFGRVGGNTYLGWAPSVEHLREVCADAVRGTMPVGSPDDRTTWLLSMIDERARSVYSELTQDGAATRLGEHAKISIGAVTGCNDFFVLTRARSRSLGIPGRLLRPIVAGSRSLRGVQYTASDQKHLEDSDIPCLLLDTGSRRRYPHSLQSYLEVGKAAGVDKHLKCAQRPVWHHVCAGVPHAFMQYMCTDHPRIAVNAAEAACTNSLHQITWTKLAPRADHRWVALGMLTSLSRLSAEICGRGYGGGLLKLEPSDAAQLVLPASPSGEQCGAFEEADQLVRAGRKDEAAGLADAVLLGKTVGLTKRDVAHLRCAWAVLRDLRLSRSPHSAASSPRCRARRAPGS